MSKIKKDEQMHIRCTSQQKEDAKKILRVIGKTSDFILEFFLNEFNSNAATLELQKYFIDQEIAEMHKQIEHLTAESEKLALRSKLIDDEISNKTVYDLSNYKNNDAVTNAVNSIRSYVLQRNITDFNNIPEDLFLELNENFKVHNLKLLMEISKNEYDTWYSELKNTDNTSVTVKMQKIADRLNTDFKHQSRYTNWTDYIESRDEYIESKANADNELNPVDLKVYLRRKNYDHKYKFQKK